MNIDNQKLSDLIHKYIKKQTEQNKQLSASRVSEQLGIPAPTLNRIINGRSKPSMQTLIKLSKYIPEIKSFLPQEVFEVVLEKTNGEMLGERLEALLFDSDMFLIYALAFSDNGVTKEVIIQHFGTKKISKLTTLEKEGFIEKEGNNGMAIYKASKKQTTMSFKLVQKHIETLNKFYKINKPEDNYACYGMDTLNSKGVLELMLAIQEFHKKALKIMDKEENKGNTPVFFTAISDILFEPITEKKRGNNEYN